MGLMPISRGSITYANEPIHTWPADKRARLGIGYVPQGRDIFPNLTVWENLKVSIAVTGDEDERSRLDEVYTLFPILYDMLKRKGGVLSGGQQQQLAIARALMTGSRFILLDEPALGLAPIIVETVYSVLHRLRRERAITLLIVEQSTHRALENADRIYVLRQGRIELEGPSRELDEKAVEQAYFGYE